MNKIVSSALIKNQTNEYLLIKLNKEKVGGVWVPPGGKLEDNESLRDCAIREVKEELGIEIEIEELVGISEEDYPNGVWTFVYFTAHIKSGEPKIMEIGKIIEFSWNKLGKIKNHDRIKWLNLKASDIE